LKKGNERIPWYTKHKDERIMLLAGLYDCTVLEGETKPLWTFSIVTTEANKEFEWLHERQPVILSSQAAIDTWLDTSSQSWTDQLTNLVAPYHDTTSPIEWCVRTCLRDASHGIEAP
jgi:putative SOS response-associated peptidase YedK